MNSCIYEGTVMHARHRPRHHFRYRLFMMYLDLDELPRLFAGRWLWSSNFPNLAWFSRKDYLGRPDQDLAEAVRDLVEQRTGDRPAGSIRLLTNLRYFGFLINPISLYYCFDASGSVEFVVAEVTNTPWGERHCYVLDTRYGQDVGRSCWKTKKLHVSPFMSMDYRYRFNLSQPAEDLRIGIENHPPGSESEGQSPVFVATLAMKRLPVTGWSLSRVLLRYPLMTLQIALAIYWQALRLYLKGAEFVVHPDKKRSLGHRRGTTMVSERKMGLEKELENVSQ